MAVPSDHAILLESGSIGPFRSWEAGRIQEVHGRRLQGHMLLAVPDN